MAQTNYTPISLYYSTTASAVPTAANLVPGELAINTNDGKLYYEDSSGVVQVLATKSTGSIGGSNTQVQFNNSGSLGGSSGLTWDGSFLTTSSIKNSALTSGRVTYAGASGLLTDSANLLYSGTDLTVYGLTVGRGNGAISTNTVIGYQALASTSAGLNTVYGYQAGYSNTTANLNSYFGYQAGYTLSTGGACSAFGYQALKNNTGANNNAYGSEALLSNTSGTNNHAFGTGALAVNSTGSNNVAVGGAALNSNSSGGTNTAVGQQALTANTTASQNTAVGYKALFSKSTGNSNTAMGYQALYNNTTSVNNVAVGADALYNATGDGNTSVGTGCGSGISTGSYNTAIGLVAMTATTYTGTFNTCIGYNANPSSASVSSEFTLGDSSIATLRCQVTTITALSDARDKENVQELQAGLDFVSKLKPVSFDWNMRDGGKVGIADIGFIAQDLKQVQIDTGIVIPDLVYEENPERLEAGYGKLLPVLVKAIQELKAEFDAYKATHP